MSLNAGVKGFLPFVIPATELAAGTATEIVAPCNGWVEELQLIVQTAIGTGGAVTLEINTVAVAGISIAVADSATKGTRYSDTPTEKSGTRYFAKGDRITITPASEFATAGALAGNVVFNSADTDPAL